MPKQLDRDGSLDDPSYIAGLKTDHPLRTRQNVYATSMAAASAMTNQFLSLVVGSGGQGDPGPLRYDLRSQRGAPSTETCPDDCAYRKVGPVGDGRVPMTGHHVHATRTTGFSRVSSCRLSALRFLVGIERRIECAVTRKLLTKTGATRN